LFPSCRLPLIMIPGDKLRKEQKRKNTKEQKKKNPGTKEGKGGKTENGREHRGTQTRNTRKQNKEGIIEERRLWTNTKENTNEQHWGEDQRKATRRKRIDQKKTKTRGYQDTEEQNRRIENRGKKERTSRDRRKSQRTRKKKARRMENKKRLADQSFIVFVQLPGKLSCSATIHRHSRGDMHA